MHKYTKKELMTLITGKLRRNFGRDVEEATSLHMFKACALVLRDIMSERQMKTADRVAVEHLRQVHYLSLEFLMGRSLMKNAYNLGVAEPLKQALRNNLETLRSFGARLTTSGGLYDKTLRAVGGVQARTAAPAARPEAEPRKQEGSGQLRLEGRVLSGRHVQGCPPHSTLWVPRETLITQLAADEARRRDICIRKET